MLTFCVFLVLVFGSVTIFITLVVLTPLKTSENMFFLAFSVGIEKDRWHEMGVEEIPKYLN